MAAITWNPADKHADISLSGGDLTASCTVSSWRVVRATASKNSGKFYFEVVMNAAWALIGIAKSVHDLSVMMGTSSDAGGIDHIGECIFNGALAYDGASLANGDVVGCAVDIDAGTLALRVNNVAYYTIFGFAAATAYFPAVSLSDGGNVTAHFSAASFIYAPPAGYASLEEAQPGNLVQYVAGEIATSKATIDALGSINIPVGQGFKIGGVALPTTIGGSGFSLCLGTTSSSTTTDGQTAYFGFGQQAVTTTAAVRRVYAPKACSVKAVTAIMYATTAGTAESFSIYIRVNNATDTLIATVALSSSWRVFTNAALNIALASGDYFEIKIVYPTWATNPATVIWGATVFCQ